MSEPTAKPELNLRCASQIDAAEATPMVRQFLDVKREYPGVILLYRMGDFYETFFEDAIIISRALEITLTGRDAGKLGRIPMAGVPARAVDGYIGRLLEKNFKVAMCDQTEDPALAKGLVERRVTRVLTSGTIADSRFLTPGENNFLAALWPDPKRRVWGYAYCDATTGGFYATEIPEEACPGELDRVRPSELLLPGRKQRGPVADEWLAELPPGWADATPCTALSPDAFDASRGRAAILKWLNLHSLESLGMDETPAAVGAVGAILGYLDRQYLEDARPVFETIIHYQLTERLEMNAAARRHLELTHTVKDGRSDGSLLSVLDRTSTSMGARLLREWLQSPSVNLGEIESRLEAVDILVKEDRLRGQIRDLLPGVHDLERLGMKVRNLSTMPRDLAALKRSCDLLPHLAEALVGQESFYLSRIAHLPSDLVRFAKRVGEALAENPAVGLKEGQIFRLGFNPDVDRYRTLLETQQEWLSRYEASERERTGLKTLKVGINNTFGYYIEISKAASAGAPADYQRRQTLTNAERYITPELKAHEDQVFEAQNRLFDLEYELFLQLREDMLPFGTMLAETARRVAALDILQSFATVAVERQYNRPHVDKSDELNLQDARHPVVETMLPMGAFVGNDCALSAAPRDHRIPQMMIITGPNMAGKSTYMRQIALITLMAQMGSFVPAGYARIGLVDQIFTRIGAIDDLAGGQSTFMVEMTETAAILNRATPKSLVLLDEVGRGTSTYDGVSIAWSVAEYLVNHNGCRTLFATHYHELNTLEQLHPKIQNVRVLVSEEDGQEIAFLHRVVPGAAQKSYGIHVAQMAGLPRRVIEQAERLMNRMQEKEFTTVEKRRQAGLLEVARREQLSLFPQESPALVKNAETLDDTALIPETVA